MSAFINPTTLFHAQFTTLYRRRHRTIPSIRSSISADENSTTKRKFVATFLAGSVAAFGAAPLALAEKWGTRSFLKERFFEPGLSPEDAAARIRQTAEGLHSIREMLDTMSWRYVLFYIRLKQAYLSQDMTNAMATVPESRRGAYVQAANDLVDSMTDLDIHVRTPRVYESYLYYEKTLKSIDALVALL